MHASTAATPVEMALKLADTEDFVVQWSFSRWHFAVQPPLNCMSHSAAQPINDSGGTEQSCALANVI